MPRQKKPEPPKPSVLEIRAARPLTAGRDPDPPSCCNVCHLGSRQLGVWRERDEYDKPVEGTGALVFIGKDHPTCLKIMENHPRLYEEEEGQPGWFPALCGPCRLRDGLACRHTDLKENGGAGLQVMPADVRICRRPRSESFSIRTWVECKGRDLRKPPAAAAEPGDAP